MNNREASLVDPLRSPASSYVTGASILVDVGGAL
jgi:hypothetical protein